MLALYATLAASTAVSLTGLAATPSASVTCATEPASCDAAWLVVAAQDADEGPSDYATPAEVDCQLTVTAAVGQMFSEACDGSAPDLWYRVSREPADPAGSLAAARRGHGGSAPSSCGAPPSPSRHVTPPDVQPLALTTLPVLGLDSAPTDLPRDAQAPPGRTLAPPDRPPRV
jgi:hypothetical protein